LDCRTLFILSIITVVLPAQVLLAFMVGMTNLYHSHEKQSSETSKEDTTSSSSESFKGFLYFLTLKQPFVKHFCCFTINALQRGPKKRGQRTFYFYFWNAL